jgi:hypothetical protein
VHGLALVVVADVLRDLLHAVLDESRWDEHRVDVVPVVVRDQEM